MPTVRRTKCSTEFQAGGSLESELTVYRLLASLGAGCFAEVFKAQCRSTKRVVAVKVLPHEGASSAQNHQQEAQRLAGLSHPNIVVPTETFRFVGQIRAYTCIVMDFCGGGTLLNKIRTSTPADFPSKVISQYLYQIANGLDYLHNNGIIHGDLKSDNIILTKRGTPKISDFGHSRQVTNGDDFAPQKLPGDLMFAPPEYARTHAVTMAFDSWSLGCILGEMVTLRTTGSRSPGVLFANNSMALAMLMQEVQTLHHGTFFPVLKELCTRDSKERASAAIAKDMAQRLGGTVEVEDNDDGDTETHTSLKWLLHKMVK